jgi:hypothetical protein
MPGYGVEVIKGFQFLNQKNWRLYIKNNFEKLTEPCKEVLERGLFEKCINHFESARGGSSEIDFTKINRYVWEVNPQSRVLFQHQRSSLR